MYGNSLQIIWYLKLLAYLIYSVIAFLALQNQVLRKPNGLAWVLFTDIASVQRAVDYYNSGQAVMYGTPFVISTIHVHILAAGSEENVKNKAM